MSYDGSPGHRRELAAQALPTGSQERKDVPLVRGCLDYFPAALAYVAKVSKAGNDKHNPGEEMHHARGKSMDHADCIARHLVDRGTVDPEDGLRHAGKVAWRALALLQEELEAAGEAPLARGAKLPDEGGTCTEPGGCDSCLDKDYCKGLRVEVGLEKPAFGVETDPVGARYRRTGERRPPKSGEHYISESHVSLGRVLKATISAGYNERTIVELV